MSFAEADDHDGSSSGRGRRPGPLLRSAERRRRSRPRLPQQARRSSTAASWRAVSDPIRHRTLSRRPRSNLRRTSAGSRRVLFLAGGRLAGPVRGCSTGPRGGYLVTMRRIVVVVGVCLLTVAWAALAAGGSAAQRSLQPAQGRSELTAVLAKATAVLAQSLAAHRAVTVSPVVVGASPVRPSLGGRTCFVSSAAGSCSLVPCKGFVAAARAPDWVPTTAACHAPRRLRARQSSLFRPLLGRLSPSAPKPLRETP
jgi:hypothetical protein